MGTSMGTICPKMTIDEAIKKQTKTQQDKNSGLALDLTSCKSKCQEPQKGETKGGDVYSNFESRPIQGGSLDQGKVLKKIIPRNDGRIRVEKIRQFPHSIQWPHSVHGLLSLHFDDVLYTGSATLIGPDIAITAAHNLYNFETKMEVKVSDIHFYPAANDQDLPFGVVKVVAFYYPEEFKTTGKEDYAILIFEQDIGNQTGYFGVHAMERQELESKKINITGYPADKVIGNRKHHQMWGMGGPIFHLDDNLISYQIDTYAGQDGSGIWYDAEGEYYIVGVHTHGSSDYNQGIFLNKKRLERIHEWIQSFYSKEHAISLYSLDIDKKKVGKKGAKYLSKKCFPQLQSLDLYGNCIQDEGIEYLRKADFPQLRLLNLSGNGIGENGAEHLSKANFSKLQLLDFSSNNIGAKGVEYLSKANFPQLQSLCLSFCKIGDQGVEYLCNANFPQLQSLNLYGNGITAKGVDYLSKANFPKLQILNLSENPIGDKGAEYVSKSNFPQLQALELMMALIGNRGAEHLSKANFPQLKRLCLWINEIGDEGAKYMSKSDFPQLQKLFLSENRMSWGGGGCLHEMRSTHPNAKNLYIEY